MATFISNCPRCQSNNITFDIIGNNNVASHGWQIRTEIYGVCRGCHKGTILLADLQDYDASKRQEVDQNHRLKEFGGNLNDIYRYAGFINISNVGAMAPPEYVPDDVEKAFREAATCVSVECWNAAVAMFRACIDLATKGLLPEEDTDGLNRAVRTRLHDRLEWLFDTNRLPDDLRELAKCVKDYGNDGVHDVNLEQIDAEDMRDFVIALLRRVFTEPTRVQLAIERRETRREKKK